VPSDRKDPQERLERQVRKDQWACPARKGLRATQVCKAQLARRGLQVRRALAEEELQLFITPARCKRGMFRKA